MTPDSSPIAASLNRYFLLNFPAEAARQIESFAAADVLPSLLEQDAAVLVPVWSKLVPLVAATLTRQLPADMARQLLADIPPGDAVRILFQLPAGPRTALLETLGPATRQELEQLMSYPEDSAGRLMDTRIPTYRGSMTVQEALDSLRRAKMKTARSLYLVDEEGRIIERVLLQELALADPASRLQELARPVRATVQATASREEVLETFSRYVLLDLPVVDIDGVLLGV
ncbi:MAG: magnesium transporter, partial [Halieaceae bacterium]|nr:magnesium transporter [Halieaceae bacterium]